MAANDGPAKSDEANILTILHPSSRLCTRCLSFQWPSAPPSRVNWSQRLPLHKTFYSLQESADQGCALCQFAWLSLAKSHSSTNVAESSLNNASVELSAQIYGRDYIYMSSVLIHEREIVLEGASSLFRPIESSEVELLRNMKSRHLKAFNNRGNVQKELEQLVYEQIKPWIEDCREQHADHERCGTKYVSSVLPTRLLDVGKTNDTFVKLVEAKNSTISRDSEYLTLSYCWGNGNENSKTTGGNLERRLRRFAVSELSKTIQDAILLTRLMGIQYLWVDAICIIQGKKGDFLSESPRMGDYYSNAACCISASVAKDSQEGFLTERPLARYPMDDIAIKIAKHNTGYTTFKIINNEARLLTDIKNSPLAQRGWCLQETALSRRILHWTLRGLYLECQSSVFPEGSKVPCEHPPNFPRLTGKEIMATPDEDILFSGGWYRLVSDFSRKELTYETDRLHAIHGLASVLAPRLRAEYFSGLFRPSLAHGLLWYHPPEWPEPFQRPKNAQLPSWCWASSCPVAFKRICQAPVYVKDIPERPLCFPTHSEAPGMVGSFVMGLHFRAPIFQLKIGRNKVAWMKNNSSDDTERFSCDYYLDANRHVMRDFKACPSSDEELGDGVDVLWLPVGRERRNLSPVLGLLVHEVPDKGTGVYCRYGVLVYDWPDSKSKEEQLEDVKEITLI